MTANNNFHLSSKYHLSLLQIVFAIADFNSGKYVLLSAEQRKSFARDIKNHLLLEFGAEVDIINDDQNVPVEIKAKK